MLSYQSNHMLLVLMICMRRCTYLITVLRIKVSVNCKIHEYQDLERSQTNKVITNNVKSFRRNSVWSDHWLSYCMQVYPALQLGYRKVHSKTSDQVLTEFSEAFDLVNHRVKIPKRIRWFQRLDHEVLEGSWSICICGGHGVRQNNVEPLLFVIFTCLTYCFALPAIV